MFKLLDAVVYGSLVQAQVTFKYFAKAYHKRLKTFQVHLKVK